MPALPLPSLPKRASEPRCIRWFEEISLSDLPEVGGKNAGLGELRRGLREEGVRIPDGFVVTSAAYRMFVSENELEPKLRSILEGLDPHDISALTKAGLRCRELVLGAKLSQKLAAEIASAYQVLKSRYPDLGSVAVRSSATSEDLPSASFAGLHDSFLNVSSVDSLLDRCKRCFASLFTDRAISYRIERGFDHYAVSLSVGVQRMVRSDQGASGVIFTLDTESGFRDVVLIESVFGLGEGIVKGLITPDEFGIFKTTLKTGFVPIIRRSVPFKGLKLVYDDSESGAVKRELLGATEGSRPSLDDGDIITLARWACAIEEHFQHHYGAHTPMDIEWAKDGTNNKLYVVQARPETVHARRRTEEFKEYTLKVVTEEPLVRGISVGASIAAGPVRYVRSVDDLNLIRPGDVLLAERTEPDWEPAMKKAVAIVTDHGGRTCHAAIVSREIGIPAVVGTGEATKVLIDGQLITVTCAEGSVGLVYPGALPFESRDIDLSKLPSTKTRTLLNLADPARAFRLSALPAHGVGLLRVEFIISEQIGIHPLALLEPERITNSLHAARIKELTKSYIDPSLFFVERLAEGIGTIAAAFYPREVIVRFSDFKSNEYGSLIGGRDFEPIEDNPMLGFRGASRYYHPRYRKGFALECSAIRKVRTEFGLTNVKVMIPFCRTLDEAQRVITELASNGLFQGEVGFEVYMMCEIPSNVILAAEFAQIFSGFSIGSNDLTQLILGVDRDSEIVAPLFDERNKAVTKMIKTVIREARRAGRKIGICGQAPSDFPEFTRLLVAEGIDSISFNPDSFIKGVATIAATEQSSCM